MIDFDIDFDFVFDFDFCLCLLSSYISHSSLCVISDVTSYYQYGSTALHRAALDGNIEVVRVLLAGQAKIDAVDEVSPRTFIASRSLIAAGFFFPPVV